MSGDVQPRKRNKDKQRTKKKEPSLSDIQLPPKVVKQDDDLDFDETNIHVQKDIKIGGNVVAKIFFALVFGALICMVGLIVFEHRGTGNEVQSGIESPWSQLLEGWIEDKVDSHDSHDVAHDEHEDEDEDHDLDETHGDHSGEDEEHEENEEHDDENEEENDENEEHDEENEEHEEENEEHEADDAHASEETEADDEAGIFSGFIRRYIQPTPEEEEVDEEGVFTGFINKYIYTTEATKEKADDDDEGYDSQDNDDTEGDNDDDTDADNDDDEKDRDDDDEDDEKDGDDDEDDETQQDNDDDDDDRYTDRHRYSVDKDDISGEVDKELDDDKELEDDRDLDEDNSKETDDDSKERDDEEKVVEDWRKIVYRSPAPEEDEEDGPYDIYHSAEKEDSEPKDINESGEQEDDDTNEDEPEESLIDQEHEAEDNAEPGDEDEGAGLAVKFGVGVALIVVAHVVLVSKWKANVDTDVLPPGPLPQAAQSPAYVEEISPPLPPVEEEPPPPVMDRRATLVEPGEVVLPPSDVDESDFGEYEEELDEEEEEAEMSQSDVEPTQESTLVTYEYSPVDSEQEEEGEVSDNNSAPINDKWASGASRPTVEFNSEDEEILEQTGSEVEYSDNEPEPVKPTVQTSRHGGPKSADDYLMADITNEQDWEIRDQLDAADTLYNASKVEEALSRFRALLVAHPRSPRSLHGVARCLDSVAEAKRSNSVLDAAIEAYLSVLTEGSNVPGPLLIRAAQRCIDRGRFKGSYQKIIPAHQHLINRFPDHVKYRNDLAVTYLMMARNTPARLVLEEVLTEWPEDGLAHANLGFILKQEEKHELAVHHLMRGIHSPEFAGSVEPANRGKYYYVLGDALQRLGRNEEAHEVYSEAAGQGMFKSSYQRSVHNVDRLTARPWWSLEETTYLPFFSKLERNWKKIRDEAMAILKIQDKTVGFQDEAETLVQKGDWKQFDLFVRGRKVEANCKRTPNTCRLVAEFPPASSCVRGQIKFSVIHPGTHVWPHCGPTNCRLRAHLGLVIPEGTGLRVANQTRSWEEGKVLVFDDSFEHEVWHNGSSYRLILIVDVWHPELTTRERKTLKPI